MIEVIQANSSTISGIIQILMSIYLILVAVAMKPINFISAIIFKLTPLVLGIAGLFIAFHTFGWIVFFL